jgi:DNA (cytosine-5)-methyltransferase 1
MSDELRIASLFAGCGGADLGIRGGFKYLGKSYPQATVEFVHASDVDKAAVETYNANFAHKALHADVRDVSFDPDFCDILIGGFPCQSFSTVNPTKDPEDDRGQLYRELVRLAVESKPKVIIGENVKGFHSLKGGLYFRKFTSALVEAGYDVFHQVLRAHDFGVPQKRERIFVVAFRRDLGVDFQFPKPVVDTDSHGEPIFTPLRAVIGDPDSAPEKYTFSERAVAGVKAAKPNMKRALAQDLDQPCLTITSHLAKASLNSRDPVLLLDAINEKYRRFTPHEAAAIQGFPKEFVWPQSDLKAYRQIGNAISPIVMWHLFDSVRKALHR